MPDVLKTVDELKNNIKIAQDPEFDIYDKRMAINTAKNRLFQIRDWLFETDIKLINEERNLTNE